jgi:hypothetical protein
MPACIRSRAHVRSTRMLIGVSGCGTAAAEVLGNRRSSPVEVATALTRGAGVDAVTPDPWRLPVLGGTDT